MKKFLLLFSLLITVFSFAQNKQLYSKEWKLTSLYLDGVNETIPSAPKNIYIKFNNVFSSFGFNTKVCAEILGPINYSTTASEFTITGVNPTSGTCEDTSLQNFQPKFLLFLNKNLSGSNTFTYTINVTTTGYELILRNITNDIAKFEYNFPNGDIANKIWSISSLLINSVTYVKPSNFANGNTNFSDIINTSYFNSSQITPYYTGNYIYNIGMSTTLAQHDDDAINNFDSIFHSFWRNAENNPFTYEINGDQLVITSAIGNKAYYDLVSFQGHQLFEPWFIDSIKIGNQSYFPTKISVLTFTYYETISQYCNIFNSNIIFNDATSSFNLYNSEVSNVDCFFDPAIAEFDGKYYEEFLGKRSNANYIIPNNPFLYNRTSYDNLTITNSNGDVATFIRANLSTQDLQKNQLKIYPNPTSDFIFIENLKTNSMIKVFDISGKIVLEKKLSGNSIDVKSLPKGTYFIEIEDQKPIKFIKK